MTRERRFSCPLPTISRLYRQRGKEAGVYLLSGPRSMEHGTFRRRMAGLLADAG